MKKLITIILVFFSLLSYCQETTGTLKGELKNTTKKVFENVKLTLIQVSTGFVTSTISAENGLFTFNHLQPDTNYKLVVNAIGYDDIILEGIAINLGESKNITVDLQEKSETLNEVIINVPKKEVANEKRINFDLLNKLPTQNRSIQDATRLLPEANLNSFGGANYRFNNLSIDGSSTNDVLGFQEPASGASGATASGTPGALAGTQPIGFGAIAAISIKTTPFDVTYGNFTGASINAVTRFGKNKSEVEVYSFLKNNIAIGNYADGISQTKTNFNDNQYGASLGGAFKKNKLFYFFNSEFSHKNNPLTNEPGTKNSTISIASVNAIKTKLLSDYNYDPGATSNVSLESQSVKLFFRLDYNLSNKHKITLRNNFVTGYADNLEWTSSIFNFGNQGYKHKSITNSIVGELKSKFNSKSDNKLNISYTTVNDNRTFNGSIFPHLEINENASNIIFAGTYREAAIYGLSLNTLQFKNDLTFVKKIHNFTLGTSLELNSIEYRFLTAFNGRWQYKSISNFLNDKPSRVRGVFNSENNDFNFNKETPSASYNVMLSSLYFQDAITFTNKFSVQFGVRIDSQNTQDFPISQEVKNTPEFSAYTNKINSNPQINPRFSLEYKFFKDKKVILKAGSGLFTGRMPFVWYAYAHYISGTKYFNIDYKPTTALPIVNDVSQIESSQSRRLTEINLVDSNFNLPRDWKSNISIDVKLKNNWFVQLEGTYSKVVEGLFFQSINRKESFISNFSGADSRPYYTSSADNSKINPNFTNVFLLTNTNKGYRYNITFSLNKTEKNYTGFIGYSYGISKDISSTVRNSHAANYEWNQAIVANLPNLSFSNFDLRHKISSYHFYKINLKKAALETGLVVNSRSGSPFSYVYEGDINSDGSAKNDLLYIPKNQSEIQFAPIVDNNNVVLVTSQEQWERLDNYISQDAYLSSRRGEYAERNGARTPWNHQVDLKIVYKTIVFRKEIEVSLDIFNIFNLINKNFGAQTFVSNVNNSGFALLDFVKVENKNPVFQYNNLQTKPWQVDSFSSRWQMQLGLKINL